MIKSGDKVVVVKSGTPGDLEDAKQYGFRLPKKGDIHEVDGISASGVSLYIVGFNETFGGMRVFYDMAAFRKVEPKTLQLELAEEFKESEQLERVDVPERVFSLTEKF